MEVMLRSTDRIVKVNDVPARVWEGETESGIPVICLITRVAVPEGQDQTQFKIELKEHVAPSAQAVQAFPLRFVI
ncbi:MAG: hypothetical protein NUV34_05860 [Sulfuricaulis sp.]|nr:hypothetical protein [Sulfuricaulis sp.]